MASVNGTPRKRGYRRLAAAMAWDPALMILPRFREANALNLLCLQAEVTEIEEQLSDAIDQDDIGLDSEQRGYSCSFDLLRDHGKDSKQWMLYVALRDKLNEYNEALVQQLTINDQVSPIGHDYTNLQKWLAAPSGGAWAFRGAGAKNYFPVAEGGRPVYDLVLLAPRNTEMDPFIRLSRTLLTKILRWMPFVKLEHRTFLPEESDDTYRIYGTSSGLRSIGDKFTAIVATVLILVPVIVLHFLNNANERLIVLVVFSLSFTIAMAILTEASRSELVAAAAAFIAVQVVYIGSALNNSGRKT